MKLLNRLLFSAFLSLFIYICNAQCQSTLTNVHQESYSKLSPEEQKSYIENFAKRLSSDEDYRGMKFAMEQMKDYILQMKRKPTDTVKKKRGSAEEINYYKERGMSNPEDYIRIRASMPKYIINIRSKFPAYGNLDKVVMRQVTQKADQLLKTK